MRRKFRAPLLGAAVLCALAFGAAQAQSPAGLPTPGPPLPDLIGQELPRARSQLSGFGLEVTVLEVVAEEPAGTVVRQTPGAGRRLRKGQMVALQVSRGQPVATATPSNAKAPSPVSRQTSGRWVAFAFLQAFAVGIVFFVLRGRGKS